MKQQTTIDSSGWVSDPSAIMLFGDMGRKGVAEWLPYNYTPSQEYLHNVPIELNSQVISLEIGSKHFLAGDTICTKVSIQDTLRFNTLNTPFTLFIELKKGHTLIKKYRILAKNNFFDIAIPLPDTITSGIYTLWAYTNKMRNLSTVPLFDVSFSVTNFQRSNRVSLTNFISVPKVKKAYDLIDSIKIIGKVIDVKKHQPISNAQLIILPIDSIFKHPFFTETDKLGNFQVPDEIFFYGNLELVITVKNKSGRHIDAIVLLANEESNINSISSQSVIIDSISRANLIQKYTKRNNNRLLKEGTTLSEVIIKGNKRIDFNYDSDNHLLWKIYEEPDGYILMDDKKRSYPNILLLLSSYIPSLTISGDGVSTPFNYSFRGINTLSNTKSSLKPLFLVDGIPVNAPLYQSDFLLTLLPTDINRIDYLTNQSGMYGVNASLGIVIAIYTNRGKKYFNNNSLGNLSIEGYNSLKCN